MIKKLLLIFIVLIIAFFGWRASIYFMNIAKTAVEEELRLSEYSAPNYSFYYPNGWIEKKEEGSEISFYAKNEENKETGEGISLEISTSKSQMKTPNKELCDLFAKSLATINPGMQGKTQSTVVVNTTNYEGCKIVTVFTAKGLVSTSEVKAVWYKDRRDNSIYMSQGYYFTDTNETLKATIKDSVNQFSIK